MFPYIGSKSIEVENKITKGLNIQADRLYYNKDEKVYFKVSKHGFLYIYSKVLESGYFSVIEKKLDKDGEFIETSKKRYTDTNFGEFSKAIIV